MSRPIFQQVVEKARETVAIRSRWTRFALARTARSKDCDPIDPRAIRFCAYGALTHAAYQLTNNRVRADQLAGRAAMWVTGRACPLEAFDDISMINDGDPGASRAAILALFDSKLEQV